MNPQRRRIVIDIEIHGTSEQADCVQDAVGIAVSPEFLRRVVQPLAESEQLEGVKCWVRGEQYGQTVTR